MAERLWSITQGVALLAAAVAAIAVSSPPEQVELEPGIGRSLSAWGRTWRFTSQGASQEETSEFAAALVAFEITSGGRTVIATAGERIYRSGHGESIARVAVPGVLRAPLGDLRFTVRALRGDAALVRAQFHPLATLAWALAATTVVLLLVTAWSIGRDARGKE